MRRATALQLVCMGLLSFPILGGCSKHSPTKPEPGSYKLVQAWGDSGSANGQFRYPWGVAVDASGNVYVTDAGNNRIQKFTNAGVYLSQWGDSGSANGQLNFPVHVAARLDRRRARHRPAGVSQGGARLATHLDAVIAGHQHDAALGMVEAINRKIAALRYQARGYRDPEYFKLKIFQRCSLPDNPWAQIVL